MVRHLIWRTTPEAQLPDGHGFASCQLVVRHTRARQANHPPDHCAMHTAHTIPVLLRSIRRILEPLSDSATCPGAEAWVVKIDIKPPQVVQVGRMNQAHEFPGRQCRCPRGRGLAITKQFAPCESLHSVWSDSRVGHLQTGQLDEAGGLRESGAALTSPSRLRVAGSASSEDSSKVRSPERCSERASAAIPSASIWHPFRSRYFRFERCVAEASG